MFQKDNFKIIIKTSMKSGILHKQGEIGMISYDSSTYLMMLGNIAYEFVNTASCIGQCTGCKCSCKCSCKNREDDIFEWEEF